MSERLPTPDIMGAILGPIAQPIMVTMAQIRLDGGTQMRAQLDDETLNEYEQKFLGHHAWGDFPPVVLFHDGKEYWVGDGFHRIKAFQRAVVGSNPAAAVPADVRAGTRRDAVLFAASANAAHGLRRTNADKRRSVEVLLRDDEWSQWSDREIARRCAVDNAFVGKLRKELSVDGQQIQTERTVTRNGQTYTQNTANIGQKPAYDNTPVYSTVQQLEDVVRNFVPTFYSDPGELLRAPKDMRACVQIMGGGFWKMVCNQTASFMNRDMARAIMNVALEIETEENGTNIPQGEPVASPNNTDYQYTAPAPAPVGKPMMSVILTDDEQEAEDLERDIAEHNAAADEAARQYVESMVKVSTPAPAVDIDAVLNPVPVSQRDGYDGDEWYTPKEMIDAAAAVMGGIDLDPATCELAQTVIGADVYYTKVEDGLKLDWIGNRVWLNPPYSNPEAWISKLMTECEGKHHIKQACVLVNNATETAWFQAMLTRFPVCFPARRLAFWRHDHEGVTARQGQAIFYVGSNVAMFAKTFGQFGPVLRRMA